MTKNLGIIFILSFLIWLLPGAGIAQKVSDAVINKRILEYKSDMRGPYKDIRWFCPDGSFKAPQERCDTPGGVQRARYKDEVLALAATNHIFLGQILATTPFEDFWDGPNHQSRLKQFQLERYLRSIDNGWILKRAQYYRGAFQAEDEENWGLDFFRWLLSDSARVEKHYFLIRQACQDIPHKGDDNLKQRIRANSKLISDAYAPFLDLRVKIHGQPDVTDIEKVAEFRKAHKERMGADDRELMDKLIIDMKEQYKPFDMGSLDPYIKRLPEGDPLIEDLGALKTLLSQDKMREQKIEKLAAVLSRLRLQTAGMDSPALRLQLIDLSISLEGILFKEVSEFRAASPEQALKAMYHLGHAAMGCGYLEKWEWEQLSTRLVIPPGGEINVPDLLSLLDDYRNIVEWGTGMFMASYGQVVSVYNEFESLAAGFTDEKIRSSILLQTGNLLSRLNQQLAMDLPERNRIMDIEGQSAARGLNPGFARGELVVVSGPYDILGIDKDKIYVFNKPPADLKPVAGIMTVSEGNPVSHVQLLARNLGIPNAVISLQILDELNNYAGQNMFFAVSSEGVVVLKREKDMSAAEKQLFVKRERSQERISVPVEKIDLTQNKVIDLRDLDASSSGIVCGPKAANLGQLKKLFPEKVVEGLVIPFGVFREHLDQTMPGQQVSYWEYLNAVFSQARDMESQGHSSQEIEIYVLQELALFRQAISHIKLSEELLQELEKGFSDILGDDLGKVPVFLRSDTNMEDLKDFTGAGLNLTIFNVVAKDAILKGIRDVWASPYAERSFKWRQQYLLNPENVFPSILIIPSVDVDHSGVLITKGVGKGSNEDATAAFNRGAGGAVEGQLAETYLLKKDRHNLLLAPSREAEFRRLPVSGGSAIEYSSFEQPILSEKNLVVLHELVSEVREKLPAYGTEGPYDVELGFRGDHLYLFQVRPFVENKGASGQIYLESLNPALDPKHIIDLKKNLP